MAELMDAYQRTHETMGTLAKNVGKNNETLQTTTLQLDSYASTIDEHHKQIEVLSTSLQTQQEQLKKVAETFKAQQSLFEQINSITDKLSTVVKYHQERLDSLSSDVILLRTEMVKMYKRIFWYLITVIVITGGTFIYGLTQMH